MKNEKPAKLNYEIIFYLSLIVISIFGIYLRLYWFSLKPKTLLFDEYYYYLSSAINFTEGKGLFPAYNALNIGEFVPPPLYSLFLVSMINIFGDSMFLDQFLIFQIFLSGIMIFISGILSEKIFSSKPTAFLTSLLITLYPLFIFWSSYFMTESNYLLLLSFCLLSIFVWLKTPSYINSIFSGILLGLLTLQRGLTIFLSPVLGGIIFLLVYFLKLKFSNEFSPSKVIKSLLLLCITPYLIMLPWMLRNYNYYKDPVWVSSNGGALLYYANRKELDARQKPYFYPLSKTELDSVVEKKSKDEKGNFIMTYYRYAKLYSAKTFSYIRENPFHFLKNYFWKCYNLTFLIQYESKNAGTPYYFEIWPGLHSRFIYRLIHWFLLFFGFIGFLLLLFKKPQIHNAVFIIFFLYIFFFSALFIQSADGRLTLPFRYMLCFLAAYGFHESIVFKYKIIKQLSRSGCLENTKKT